MNGRKFHVVLGGKYLTPLMVTPHWTDDKAEADSMSEADADYIVANLQRVGKDARKVPGGGVQLSLIDPPPLPSRGVDVRSRGAFAAIDANNAEFRPDFADWLLINWQCGPASTTRRCACSIAAARTMRREQSSKCYATRRRFLRRAAITSSTTITSATSRGFS